MSTRPAPALAAPRASSMGAACRAASPGGNRQAAMNTPPDDARVAGLHALGGRETPLPQGIAASPRREGRDPIPLRPLQPCNPSTDPSEQPGINAGADTEITASTGPQLR